MAFHIQSSFAAGELDPALQERTTFDKYQSGLAALRNAVIGKTGRPISRGGQLLFKSSKLADSKCVLFSPPYTPYMIEWGHLYVRIHDIDAGTFVEEPHDFDESDLPFLQFTPAAKHLYIFRFGKPFKKMVLGALDMADFQLDVRFLDEPRIFYRRAAPTQVAVSVPASTGYPVDYIFTSVIDGLESILSAPFYGYLLPIAAGELTSFIYDTGTDPGVTELRVYRRASNAGAYGYIGSGSFYLLSSGHYQYIYTDYGGEADYTHSPPDFMAGNLIFNSRTGTIYQQRLLLTRQDDEEAILASRTGFQNDFFRDFPLGADSGLKFKAGTTGVARVLRMVENDGLIVFTTVGPYVHSGALTADNLAMARKGNWVIEESVPPLEIPGGVLFVDKTTNTVRTLIYSTEAGGFSGDEVSIFSNHLFVNKKIVSWAFQDGDVPLVWTVFDDGSLISLTYQREHQMQAWSRHDTDGIYESVTVVKNLLKKSEVYFVVKRDGQRLIEKGAPRFVSGGIKELVLMDSAVTFNFEYSAGGAVINVSPQDPLDWAGQLLITADQSIFTDTTDDGTLGTTFRFFDSFGSAVDLVVDTFVDGQNLLVTPSAEFPFGEAQGIKLYKTYKYLTGLDHLEGKLITMMVDGYVKASPNNDVEDYSTITVVGGACSIPGATERGAFVHVGLPFTADVGTLDIDTVEQKPTLVGPSIICHMVYLKTYNTRGVFIGSSFLDNDSVANMESLDKRTESLDLGNIGNAAVEPFGKRHEVTIPNDWASHGRICIRQVDPLPFEFLSIIPDLEISY